MNRALPFVDTLAPGIGIIDVRTGQSWTRSELEAAVVERAEGLDAATAGPGPAIIAEQAASETLISLFAAWAGGRMAVVVNPALAPPERLNVIEHTGAQMWISDGGSIETTSKAGAAQSPPNLSLALDCPALMMMTSGTTSVPKGIIHSLRSIYARVALNIAHIGVEDLRHTLCVLPAFFGHGLIGNILTPLASGACLRLWATPQLSEFERFPEILERHRISFMSSVPTFWKLALRLAPPEQSSLRRVHVGSAPLAIPQWGAIADWTGIRDVYNMFGMTETANWIGGGRLDEANGRDGYVGRIWGGRYAILSENGDVEPAGRGEVLVASPSMMLRYHAGEAAMHAAFHQGWFRTGDVGELDDDGSLALIGRLKSEINRAGIKILAEEIDVLLERHPAVEEACSFGIPDAASGEAVAAAVVLTAGNGDTISEIRKWCRSQVRPEAVPAKLFAVDAIPRNDRGKIVRTNVREMVLAGGD